jgi:hypothetical protein
MTACLFSQHVLLIFLQMKLAATISAFFDYCLPLAHQHLHALFRDFEDR